MRGPRGVAYWLAVIAVSAALAYLLIRVAEGLDASQVGGALIWASGGRFGSRGDDRSDGV